MRQLAVILSLGLYLLNLAGNSLYIDYLMDRSGKTQEMSIDAGEYDRDDLVEIKIPFKSPYYSSSPGYERYYGEVNAGGHYYNYVERKVMNDTVYLLCLPDVEKNKLSKIKTSLAKNTGASEHNGDNKENQSPAPKKMITEYDEYFYSCLLSHPVNTKNESNSFCGSRISDPIIRPAIKPPCNTTLPG